jgi:hypothetical protein
MTRLDAEKKLSLPIACFCFIFALFLCHRWWQVFLNVCTGWVYSDVPLHIELALGGNDYGLSSLLIKLLYLGSEHFAQYALAACLTVNNLIGIFTVAYLIRYLLPKLGRCEAILASELALLCGPWIIPGYQTGIYLNAYNGNLYHNMTVLFSRTLIPVSLLCFMRCWDMRHELLPKKDWWGFAVSFLIVTAFKPSYAFAFLPVLAVMLVWDFIKYKGKYFKNELLLGCAVLPAGFICIWQYAVLFSSSFSDNATEIMASENVYVEGEEESGITVRFLWGASLVSTLVMYLRSLLLPIYTLALQGRKEAEKKHIGFLVVVELVSLLEATMLVETGYRANHGNFAWGSLALYPTVFALSCGLLIRMIQTCRLKSPADVCKCLFGLVFLLGHLLIGCYFMWFFNSGGSYFI